MRNTPPRTKTRRTKTRRTYPPLRPKTGALVVVVTHRHALALRLAHAFDTDLPRLRSNYRTPTTALALVALGYAYSVQPGTDTTKDEADHLLPGVPVPGVPEGGGCIVFEGGLREAKRYAKSQNLARLYTLDLLHPDPRWEAHRLTADA